VSGHEVARSWLGGYPYYPHRGPLTHTGSLSSLCISEGQAQSVNADLA
jgi:hypothetical protein